MTPPNLALLVMLVLSMSCTAVRPRDTSADRLETLAGVIAARDGAAAMVLVEGPWPQPVDVMATSTRARVVATSLFELGDTESREAAVRLLEVAIDWRRAAGGDAGAPALIAELLGDLASVRYFQGRWEEAEAIDREVLALRIAALGENHPEVAEARRGLGISAYKQGRLSEAEGLFELAVRGRRAGSPEDRVGLARDLNALAEVRRALGQFGEARQLFAEALEAAGDDGPLQAWILGNAGLLDKDEGRYDAALVALDRALALTRNIDPADPYRLALALQNRAEALREARRLDEAQVAMDEALPAARLALSGAAPELASFVSQNAALAAARGKLDDAESGWREALDLLATAVASDHPLRAQTLHDLGVALCGGGRESGIGSRAEGRGKREEGGEASLREALGVRESRFGESHPDTTVTRGRLARCVARDPARTDEALALVRAALVDFARTSAYPEEEAEALALEAELLEARGLPLEAIERLRRAVEIVEAQRTSAGGGDTARALRFAHWAERYRRLVALELDVGDLEGAFEVAERMRARVLLEQLAAGRVNLREGIAPEVLGPLEADERRVAALVAETQQRAAFVAGRDDLDPAARRRELDLLGRDLDAASRELARLGEQIRRESPLWREVVTAGGSLLDLERARREVVPADALLLIYQLGRSDGRVIAVPPAGSGSVRSFRLEVDGATAAALGVEPGAFGSDQLAAVLEPSGQVGAPAVLEGVRALNKIAPPGARAVASGPRRLYALWQALVPRALRGEISAAREVIIVADGALHRLPFEALVVRGGGRTPHYWLDSGPRLRYAASATVLATLSEPAQASAGALVVADPRFGAASASLRATSANQVLPSLPGTAVEADAIEAALGTSLADGVEMLRGDGASERAVREALDRPQQVVHFATHGLVDEERAELLAGLALTAGEPGAGHQDDGFLQLFEIYSLDLDAELAVLSACDSATGREIAGEGVFALSRGFLAAGARRVVASQWPVDDAATAALMGAFYQHLAADLDAGRALDVGAALEQARRVVRRDPRWQAPVYWAPFVLAGAR